MCITNINQNQIDVVAGGYEERQNIKQEMHRTLEAFMAENSIFNSPALEQCINVTRTQYGISLCLPARKPLHCPYEAWGMLHDLPEEMPKC